MSTNEATIPGGLSVQIDMRHIVEDEKEGIAINLDVLANETFQFLTTALISGREASYKFGISLIALATNTVLTGILLTTRTVAFTVFGARILGGSTLILHDLNAKLAKHTYKPLSDWAESLQQDNKEVVDLAKKAFSLQDSTLHLSGDAYASLLVKSLKTIALLSFAAFGGFDGGLIVLLADTLYPGVLTSTAFIASIVAGTLLGGVSAYGAYKDSQN